MYSTMRSKAGTVKGPAEQHIDRLDKVFGPEHFEHARMLITVARDLPGLMKVAHKVQARVNENFGAIVECIMEHVKLEWWTKLHETTQTVGLHKGEEVMDCQVTHIPDGIRVHPYKRAQLPTFEVLLLWEDPGATTRGHILYTVSHPEAPTLEQVGEIFSHIEPYFAKRWLQIDLRMAPPIVGEFEEFDKEHVDATEHDAHVGSGVDVVVLACHPFGFARGGEESSPPGGGAAHVSQCQPVTFKGVTDDKGTAKLCFLPAEVNKIQVAETARFHGSETILPIAKVKPLHEGPTIVPVVLSPKALAAMTVYVFQMPRQLPAADDTDGVIDWAAETREPLEKAFVEVIPLEAGECAVQLRHFGGGVFGAEDGGLPEGCVTLVAHCDGYDTEERAVFMLVGVNEFYVPLRKIR